MGIRGWIEELRRAAGWLDVFQRVNKIYYETSVEQLASEARRVAPSNTPLKGEQAAERSGEPDPKP